MGTCEVIDPMTHSMTRQQPETETLIKPKRRENIISSNGMTTSRLGNQTFAALSAAGSYEASRATMHIFSVRGEGGVTLTFHFPTVGHDETTNSRWQINFSVHLRGPPACRETVSAITFSHSSFPHRRFIKADFM